MQPRKRRSQQNVSMRPHHQLAIRHIVKEDGYESLSEAVQDLIERAITERLGVGWRRILQDRQQEAAS